MLSTHIYDAITFVGLHAHTVVFIMATRATGKDIRMMHLCEILKAVPWEQGVVGVESLSTAHIQLTLLNVELSSELLDAHTFPGFEHTLFMSVVF